MFPTHIRIANQIHTKIPQIHTKIPNNSHQFRSRSFTTQNKFGIHHAFQVVKTTLDITQIIIDPLDDLWHNVSAKKIQEMP